INKLDE
ncbi:General stress protein A, partial [Haemophilus influenzae]